MTRPIAVLRPEPGNRATCARVRTAGAHALALPLFEIVPLNWTPPDPTGFDALILTSANAVRAGGEALAGYTDLPVYAVGAATARAAEAAGFAIAAIGNDDADALIAAAATNGVTRALHLGGRETGVVASGIIARSIAVYASEAIEIAPEPLHALIGATALLHSARAADRLGMLVARHGIDPATIALAAISPSVAQAAGPGWGQVVIAAHPNDAALIAAALAAGD